MELYVGGDLSRKRLDWYSVWADGAECAAGASPPDSDGLAALARSWLSLSEDVVVVIESMTGARFVHDQLEASGVEVKIADARKARVLMDALSETHGAKTDRLDARGLSELGRLDMVPEIWLADPATRQARELARFRLHLVRQRTMLKNRIHQTLITHGVQRSVSDLFGRCGRERLERLSLPEPWQRSVRVSLELIDHLDEEIDEIERSLRKSGADHPYLPLLMSVPGIGWILGFTIASEIGSIERFESPRKLIGYTGLCPRVLQSGESDRRGPIKRNGPKWLRWALVEASQNAARNPIYRERYERTKKRLGRQKGPKVAQIDLARKLSEAIWYMLTRNESFAPAGAERRLAS
ncbi:MAG: IS110 family transposase [Gaiellaceae bacterium]|jgi:transposase